jgi:hypothetical protein
MGLFSKALAVGFGYALAQPEVRRKLVQLVRHPKVEQLREQIQDVATDGLQTAKRQLNRSSATDTIVTDTIATDAPTPTSRASDLSAFREGVLPPATDIDATTATEDS